MPVLCLRIRLRALCARLVRQDSNLPLREKELPAGLQDLRAHTASLVKCGGAYLAKSANGRVMRLQVTK